MKIAFSQPDVINFVIIHSRAMKLSEKPLLKDGIVLSKVG